jgi:hypothetical protein
MRGLDSAFYGMLAYVFWHWPRPGVSPAVYEATQRRFHSALAGAPPPGFIRSFSAALSGAPWAAQGGPAYEDWYLVDRSAALDPLNQAAITASRQAPHDAAAALAAGGAAGLYVLRAGTPLPAPRHATWFAKPRGMTYADLDATLRDVVAGGACLWMRYMVLGPTPEFCLQSAAPLNLPLDGVALELRSAWETRL